MTVVDWTMTCSVNGSNFSFDGTGRGQAEEGTLELSFKPTDFPDGFDPVSCPCICNAPASILFAGLDVREHPLWRVGSGGLSVAPTRIGVVYDAKGNQLLHLEVSSAMMMKGDRVVIGNQMRGVSRLPKIVRTLTPAREWSHAVCTTEYLSTTRFQLMTAEGEILNGYTTVPFQFATSSETLPDFERVYKSIEVDWDGGRNVRSRVQSQITLNGQLDRQRPGQRSHDAAKAAIRA